MRKNPTNSGANEKVGFCFLGKEEKMPYKVLGNKVYSKSTGDWRLKQTCGSPEKAKAAMRLLYGIKSGNINAKDIGNMKHVKRGKK